MTDYDRDSTRKAVALLTAHVADDWTLRNEVLRDYLTEGPGDVQTETTRLLIGMTNVAMFLLVLRERDSGISPAQTLREVAARSGEAGL